MFQLRFGVAGADSLSARSSSSSSDPALLMRFLDALQDHGVRPTSRGLCFVSSAHDDARHRRDARTLAAALATI